MNDRYLGFEYRLEENLNTTDTGKSKAVELYRKVKSSIVSKDKVPSWVSEWIDKVEQLPTEAESVLYHKENNT